jgi:hypothetical protein
VVESFREILSKIPQKVSSEVNIHYTRNILNKFVKETNKPLTEAVKHRELLTESEFGLIVTHCEKGLKLGKPLVDKKRNLNEGTTISLGLTYG